MKMSHRLESVEAARPVWSLAVGLVLTIVGVALWVYAPDAISASRQVQSLAVASTLVGLFVAVYAGREVVRKRG